MSQPHAVSAAEKPTNPTEFRRVIAASVVGTALEWYDFFIYGTAAALVFDELFFTDAAPGVGTLAAFATFGVGFLFRPLGGFLFGRLGDRIGRRSTLVITTLVMGLATGLIGLLPTYSTLGYAAPVLLLLLRICQGLGAGAEFGGASTLLSEHAPPHRRGFFGSFAQTGVQIGLILGNLAFLLVNLLPEQAVESWAWRVPFLLSFVMIAVSLYVRLRVQESPVFQSMTETNRLVRTPISEALRSYPRSFLVGMGAHICDTTVVYLYATYTVAYVTDQLGMANWVPLSGVIIFSVIVIALQPVYGALSDRIGRRPLNLFSVIFTAVFAYPYFLLLNTESIALVWTALVVATAFGFAPMIAVQPVFYAELFGAKVRYTGFASSREVGAAIAGFSPLIAGLLAGALGGAPWLVAAYMVLASLVTFVAFWYSRETKSVDITALDVTQDSVVGGGTARPGEPGKTR